MAAGKIGYPFTINQENTFMVCKESVFVSHVEKREHAKLKTVPPSTIMVPNGTVFSLASFSVFKLQMMKLIGRGTKS